MSESRRRATESETPDGLADRRIESDIHTARKRTVPSVDSGKRPDASGEYYFPPDGCTSWADCSYKGNPLIPKEADKAAVKARRQARMETLA
jgi:hypothetical protein